MHITYIPDDTYQLSSRVYSYTLSFSGESSAYPVEKKKNECTEEDLYFPFVYYSSEE
jgi:hypothetical protein